MSWLLFAPAAANHLDIIIILLTTATIFIATHVHCSFYFRRLMHHTLLRPIIAVCLLLQQQLTAGPRRQRPVLKCRVKLGKALDVGRSGNSSLNLNSIEEQGCDSLRVPRSGTEYCVYEPSRIRVVDRCEGHPLVRLQRPCSQCSGWSGDCFLCMGTGIADYYEDAAKFSSSAHRR